MNHFQDTRNNSVKINHESIKEINTNRSKNLEISRIKNLNFKYNNLINRSKALELNLNKVIIDKIKNTQNLTLSPANNVIKISYLNPSLSKENKSSESKNFEIDSTSTDRPSTRFTIISDQKLSLIKKVLKVKNYLLLKILNLESLLNLAV